MHYLDDFELTDTKADLALEDLHSMALAAQKKDSSLSEVRQSGGYVSAALKLAYAE